MPHPVLTSGRVAVITGAAGGIGLAASKRFAALGMKVCMVDSDGPALEGARGEVASSLPTASDDLLVVPTDVSDLEAVRRLREHCLETFGAVDLLMNNAACFERSRTVDPAGWREVLEVNLWGVIHGTQTFLPAMLARGEPGLVVNTGSKQGITTPPGTRRTTSRKRR